MALKKQHLGRGLSALLGGDEIPATEAGGSGSGQRSVPVEFLHPGRYQPRRTFNPQELEALAQSMRENGMLQPILVRPHPDRANEFEIIAGERRWRAAQMAQLHDVPIIERPLADRDALEIAIIENVQRSDLNPLEEAEGYRRLMAEFNYTHEMLAERIGKSRPAITNLLRLLDLPGQVRSLLVDGRITSGHARALLGAADPVGLAEEIVAKGLSVRQTEELAGRQKAAKRAGSGAKKASAPAERDADTRALERDISLKLGLKTEIEFNGKSGRLVLHYSSLDQLDALIEKLNG
jgi:ParB family chromosome partitioning protein